jgi:hypothetical protein
MKRKAPTDKQLTEELLARAVERLQAANKRKADAARDVESATREATEEGALIDALRKAKQAYEFREISAKNSAVATRVKSGHNRNAIVEILTVAGRAMRVADIAKQAHLQAKIQSRRGYDGIYATCSTVLARNSNHVFIHLKGGLWDIRDRRATNGKGADDKPTNLFSEMLKGPPVPPKGPPIPKALAS